METSVQRLEMALGLVAGLMAGVLSGVVWTISGPSRFFETIWCWVDEHETLTAGILSVAAASVSVYFLYRQIQQQSRLHNEDKRGRLIAGRSLAPAILKELQQHGKECWVIVLTLLEEADEPMAVRTGQTIPEPDLNDVPKLPKIDERLFSDLKDWITYEDKDNSAKLARVLSDYQIFHSRMPTHKHPSLYKSSLKITAVKIATFLLVIEDCWEMARRDLAPYDRLSNNALNLVDALFGSAISDISPNFVYKTTIHDELKENIRKELRTGATP